MKLDNLLIKQDEKLKEHWEEKITSYQLIGTLYEGGNTVDFEFAFKLPNLMQVKVKIGPEKYYFEGYNGKRGWEMYEYVEGDAEDALRHAAEWPNSIISLQDFVEGNNSAQFMGSVEINEDNYYLVELQHKSGRLREYYVDKDLFEIRLFREKRKLHPNEQPSELETIYEDYRVVDGLKIPSHVSDRRVGDDNALIDILWDYAVVQPDLDNKTFDKLEK